ncbi:MAG TPA: CHASE domain-containing protein, partial [Bacillota bacterium]|nr:CHASE domain-containing protein [Bacillota bacterium]
MNTKTSRVSFSGWRQLTASRLISWLVLLASLLLTLWVWRLVDKSTQELGQARFDLQAEGIRNDILERMDNNERMLRGCVGLFNALPEVTRQTWRAYIESLQLERNYPGVEGVGFAKRVQPAELASHLQQMHAEGFTNYSVRPEGVRPEYFPVIFLEPFEKRNLRAFGFDTFSEAMRRATMERARDTGQAALTGKVILVQESPAEPMQSGFLLYFPVYAKGRPLRSSQERRAALLGFAYSPLRAGDFLQATLFPEHAEVSVEVFDGAGTRPEGQLFDSSLEVAPGQETGKHGEGRPKAERRKPSAETPARFTRSLQMQLYGQTWTVNIASLPGLEKTLVSSKPEVTLAGGIVLSWLLFGLTWAQASRQRAEMALRRAKAELEQRVQERTAELAQTNARLGQSEEDLKHAQAVAHTGSWRLDIQRNELLWSDETYRIFGISKGTPLTYETFLNRILPEDRAAVDQAWQAALQGAPYDIEHRIRVQDTVKWVRERAVLEASAQGQLIGGFGTVQDITERKAVEEMLRQTRDAVARANAELERRVQERTRSLEEATKLLNDFCYSIAHDLKAPIRAQVSFAQILLTKSGRQLGPEGRHYAERIVEAASRQGQLVSDLLAHMSLGRADLPLEPVPLAKALALAQTDLRLEIEQRHARLHIAELAQPVLANPASLHLVLLNLLSNALKFVPRGSRPEIKVWAEEVQREGVRSEERPTAELRSQETLNSQRSTRNSFVRLWVEDNGIGIPLEQREKLFGVFQRLHPREPYPGTGIGL